MHVFLSVPRQSIPESGVELNRLIVIPASSKVACIALATPGLQDRKYLLFHPVYPVHPC
jgi:hypothetical protein